MHDFKQLSPFHFKRSLPAWSCGSCFPVLSHHHPFQFAFRTPITYRLNRTPTKISWWHTDLKYQQVTVVTVRKCIEQIYDLICKDKRGIDFGVIRSHCSSWIPKPNQKSLVWTFTLRQNQPNQTCFWARPDFSVQVLEMFPVCVWRFGRPVLEPLLDSYTKLKSRSHNDQPVPDWFDAKVTLIPG